MKKLINLEKNLFKALFLSVLFLSLGSCKKNQTIDDTNLAGSNVKGSAINVLNISTAQVSTLRQAFVTSKATYSNQYGSLKSFASAMGEASPGENPTYKDALKEILSDNFISSIINEDGEIIVDGNIYKVTVFGTFKTTPSNRANLEALVSQLYEKYKVKDINVDKPKFDLSQYYANGTSSIKRTASASGLVQIDCPPVEYVSMVNNIDYYPSFNEEQFPCDGGGGGGGGGGYYPPVLTSPNDHPMFYPGNMITENMVNPNGSFWTTVFENATHYNYFDSDYRTSVLFYNRNYGFIKTLGIKVKQQKDGWFWWNSTDASAIVAGWETISYQTIPKQNTNNYYVNVYPAQTHYYQTDVLPNDIQIMKVQNSGGTFYIPLILANTLPIPEEYKNQGRKGVIKFIWDLIKKKIEEKVAGMPTDPWSGIPVLDKDGNDTYERLTNFTDLLNLQMGALLAGLDNAGQMELVLPATTHFAYNTDMIDIPLDDYHSDILTGGSLIIKAVFNPSQGGSALFNFTKDEFSRSFKVTEANVYVSSTRGGLWRGVRVVHN